ncbi:cell number regulator 8, partial [Carica papaya]|uniref:cell number regulator 8 n=1 Tax=Carica papaya TaxID=3649 RepID=UPI000B8CB463
TDHYIWVGLLGSVAPCVLYGSNVERLGSAPGTFSNHCLPYSGLYMIGNSFFGWNCLAPWFSYPTRTAIRRKFNLEGSCEALNRSCGCCGSCAEDELQREQCETACDFMTHVLCHSCALCQEGRELRRRLPHPGFNAQPVLVMIPPGEQMMGREA